MTTVLIDASQYATGKELHGALKAMLGLPDYYGMNADALYDCLSERQETVSLWIVSSGEGEVAGSLSNICHVIRDLGGSVKEVRIR